MSLVPAPLALPTCMRGTSLCLSFHSTLLLSFSKETKRRHLHLGGFSRLYGDKRTKLPLAWQITLHAVAAVVTR